MRPMESRHGDAKTPQMRKHRSWTWLASVAGLAVVIAFACSGCTAAPASRNGAATTAVYTAASPAIICGPETSLVVPERVLPGGKVTGWFTRFEPNVTVAITFRPTDGAYPARVIGTTTTDEEGYGIVDVVVPADAPIGQADIALVLDECAATAFPSITLATIFVVPVVPAITIDDDTVVPGQRVTISASGFAHDDAVDVFLDSNPMDGPESGWLATAETTSAGSVVISVRLPRSLSPGPHTLFVAGWGPDRLFPEVLSVDIVVGAGATTPPTDTN